MPCWLLQADIIGTCSNCNYTNSELQLKILSESLAVSIARLGSHHEFLVSSANPTPQQQLDVTAVKYLTKSIAKNGCLWVSLNTTSAHIYQHTHLPLLYIKYAMHQFHIILEQRFTKGLEFNSSCFDMVSSRCKEL